MGPENKKSLWYSFVFVFCSPAPNVIFVWVLKIIFDNFNYYYFLIENLCNFPSGTIPSFYSEGITECSCFVFSSEEYSIVILLCLTLKDSLLALQKGVTSWSRLAHFFVQISKIWTLCILLMSMRHWLPNCFQLEKTANEAVDPAKAVTATGQTPFDAGVS